MKSVNIEAATELMATQRRLFNKHRLSGSFLLHCVTVVKAAYGIKLVDAEYIVRHVTAGEDLPADRVCLEVSE